MHRYPKMVATLSLGLMASLPATVQPAESNPVTAIDILLDPDDRMVKHAEA